MDLPVGAPSFQVNGVVNGVNARSDAHLRMLEELAEGAKLKNARDLVGIFSVNCLSYSRYQRPLIQPRMTHRHTRTGKST